MTIYSKKHIRRMKRFEAEFLRAMFEALHSQALAVVRKLKAEGIDHALAFAHRMVLNDKLSSVIKNIYSTIGLYFANKTILEIKKTEQKAGFGFNEEFVQSILNYFSQYLLNKAVIPISESTRELIIDVLNKGISEGWGVDKIANELESPELSLWRARMIVRTESNKAMNYGQKLGEQKSEWETTKKWIAANDHRTRHSHREVDDHVIDFNKYFRVSIYRKGIKVGEDLMDGPGDIHAHASNVINCRCTLAFAAKRDSSGRLIRKRNISVLLPHDINRNRTIITI